jgi:rubrerythrin
MPHATARRFARYVGIDYSGAQTPTSSLKGLRVYMSEAGTEPTEVLPSVSTRKYWSRRGVAEWLLDRLAENIPTLVGIDHGFSFPLRYFETHGVAYSWPAFLDDFQRHWPTDGDDAYVDFVREGVLGNGAARYGNNRWRRLTEQRAGAAKSVFHFDVQGSVAKSTHSGIPWLRFVRQRAASVHFWSYDGWTIPAGHSAITEVYPALWSRGFENIGRTGDQHDAYSIAAWLAAADGEGTLGTYLHPDLTPSEYDIAQIEGWILGALGSAQNRTVRSAEADTKSFKFARRHGRQTAIELAQHVALESEVVPPVKKTSRKADQKTTEPGYTNKNHQTVLRKTLESGNDHNQKIYILSCGLCGHEYGANGSDIWLRRCPACSGGARGL